MNSNINLIGIIVSLTILTVIYFFTDLIGLTGYILVAIAIIGWRVVRWHLGS